MSKILRRRGAPKKYSAGAASVNFGWLGGIFPAAAARYVFHLAAAVEFGLSLFK